MKMLAFDCSSKTMAAAVAEEGRVLAKDYSEENRNHAPYLMPMIQKVLADSGTQAGDMDAIGVTIGPGSFTGLRIGIATAKGFSDTLQIPMLPLLSLDALALGLSDYQGTIVTMLDARKNQVYAAVYHNQEGQMEKVLQETPLDPSTDLTAFLAKEEEILFVGDGVLGWQEKLLAAYGERCAFRLEAPQGIQGENLIALAEKAHHWDFTDDITPFYIRSVDAKAKFLQYQLVKMKEQDIEELLVLENASFPKPWTKGMFHMELKNMFAHYWVIRTDETLSAYGGFWMIGNECHITNIAVHPDYRHLGQGTLMVKHLLSMAKKMGANAVTLEVRTSNEKAISLYERDGFQNHGTRPHYYEDGEDAMIMWHHFPKEELREKPWSK